MTEQQPGTEREKTYVTNFTLALPVIGYKTWREFGGQ